jgi:hypothetical protein
MGKVWKRIRALILFAPGLALLLAAWPSATADAAQRGRRTISGGVNFTNNTPPAHRYLFQLYTYDLRRVVATRKTDGEAGFTFRNLKPGRYVLIVSGPYICRLWYEVDVRREPETELTILGDADCSSRGLRPARGRKGSQ